MAARGPGLGRTRGRAGPASTRRSRRQSERRSRAEPTRWCQQADQHEARPGVEDPRTNPGPDAADAPEKPIANGRNIRPAVNGAQPNPAEEHDRYDEPESDRPHPEEMECEERGPAPANDALLIADEADEHRHRTGEHCQRPGRPTGFTALDDRINQEEQAERCESDADEIHHARCQDDRGEPDRNIDEEDQPPRLTEQVQADEEAAEQLPGSGGPRWRR